MIRLDQRFFLVRHVMAWPEQDSPIVPALPTWSRQAAAILWYPGSFAPFHVGHLNCLRAAKKELSEHLHVAGAYVQPQPFGHLAYKLLVSTRAEQIVM